MTIPYCTLDDVYNLGLSAQAFVRAAREIRAEDVDTSTGRIRYKGHGYSSDSSKPDKISFEVTEGGSLPAELAGFDFAYTTPLPLGFDIFQIATAYGGTTPIASFTSAGSGWAIALDPVRRLEANILAEAAAIDNDLTAHSPPIEADPITGLYPLVVVRANAIRAALATVTTLQFENAEARRAVDVLLALKADVDKDLAEWFAGRAVRPDPTDATDIPDNGARASASADMGWLTGEL